MTAGTERCDRQTARPATPCQSTIKILIFSTPRCRPRRARPRYHLFRYIGCGCECHTAAADMLLIHAFAARPLQSTLRHRSARALAGSTSTFTLYRLTTRCLSISGGLGLPSRHVLQTRTQSHADRRSYSSHAPPTPQQQSPFSLSRLCEQSIIFIALYSAEMLTPRSPND